jgi:transposase
MKNEEMVTITKQEYQELLAQKATIELLKHQLAELQRIIFGAKSERYIPSPANQTTLFELPEQEVAEMKTEEISYTRQKSDTKKQALRLEIPSHLPRKEEVVEPDFLPEQAKKIGENITEVLEYEPANIYVRRIVRPKYIISQDDEQTHIITAELPNLPIPKGNAGASLLAHILVSKFVDHLPFYRQTQIFKRQELNISESTINGWFNASCRLLEPLYKTLKNQILKADYLMADETPIPIQTKDKPGATHKGYYWVYYDPVHQLAMFDYNKTRGREAPDEILKDFSGHLQTDGYTAYNNLKNQRHIIQLACMAHARRKFEHALDNDRSRANWALNTIGKLYQIERSAKEQSLTRDEIYSLRQKDAKPILAELKSWLDKNINETLPKSAIGQAIAYTLTLWSRLERYIEDGKFKIDNNLIENSIRPVAIGRKNYLFAGSHDAAQQAAIIYSLLACCKMHEVEPLAYLTKVLDKISVHPANRLAELLPSK